MRHKIMVGVHKALNRSTVFFLITSFGRLSRDYSRLGMKSFHCLFFFVAPRRCIGCGLIYRLKPRPHWRLSRSFPFLFHTKLLMLDFGDYVKCGRGFKRPNVSVQLSARMKFLLTIRTFVYSSLFSSVHKFCLVLLIISWLFQLTCF